MRTPEITMYGADWCSDCTRAKNVLESHDVAFEYINLVESPEKAGAAQAISGRTSIPVITFPDGSYLVEPSNGDLESKLREVGVL
jgi:glutaredoxin